MRNSNPVFNVVRVTLSAIAACFLFHWLGHTSWSEAITFALIWDLLTVGAVIALMRAARNTDTGQNAPHPTLAKRP